MKKILPLAFLYLCATPFAAAQVPAGGDDAWDSFVEEYFSGSLEEEDAVPLQADLYDVLEELHDNPVNLNAAGRDDLLKVPFLTPAQADSILSYRQRKHGFLSLGELMFIPILSHTDRRNLSLFFSCEPEAPADTSRWEKLYKGRHSLESRVDIPLYKRAGYKQRSEEELRKNPNSVYLGNGLRHIVRYRYQWRQSLAYGLTLEKDPGEPFGSYATYPYDYNSFYLHYRPLSGRWEVLAGDYNVRIGEGLLMGNSFFSSRLAAVTYGSRAASTLKPHTSADETDFFRGAAGSMAWGSWKGTAFVSYRKLDARTKDGKVTSLKTDGMHRTLLERQQRHNLGNLTAGARLAYARRDWQAGLNAFFTRYGTELAPTPRPYNRYYLRGHGAAGFSADYRYQAQRWSFSGETAADRSLHLATSNTLRYEASGQCALFLQQRSLSRGFVSPFGATLQQASRVANEHGILFGSKFSLARRVETTAYLDLFRFPAPTFRAFKGSSGMELFLQSLFFKGRSLSFLLRYKLKCRQQDVSGFEGVMETRQTHRARLQLRHDTRRLYLCATADFTAACRQTATPSLGWMLSARGRFSPARRASIGAFGGFFSTADYASAVYAYEPQLRNTFAMPAFYGRGLKVAALVQWDALKSLRVACRYSFLHYLDRETAGSGLQQTDSPTLNDLSLYVCWKF